ncbi:MAG: hypothetical protein L0L69_07175, partial [Propionibacterium sp.]|nr:hypothetical protein [Propionibacterium sp.]
MADIRGTCDPLAGTLLLETTLEGTGLRTWEASTLVGPGRREPGATDALGTGSLAQSLVVGAHAAQPLEFTAFLGLVTSLDAEVADTDAGSGPHPSPRHLHPDTQARARTA